MNAALKSGSGQRREGSLKSLILMKVLTALNRQLAEIWMLRVLVVRWKALYKNPKFPQRMSKHHRQTLETCTWSRLLVGMHRVGSGTAAPEGSEESEEVWLETGGQKSLLCIGRELSETVFSGYAESRNCKWQTWSFHWGESQSQRKRCSLFSSCCL